MPQTVIEIGWTGLLNQMRFHQVPSVCFPEGFGNLLAHGVTGLSLIVVDGPRITITKHPKAKWGIVVLSLENFLYDHFGPEDTTIVRPGIPIE